ncbi:MAG: OsmC family protein, partial [Bacteroidota bacterium]
AFFELKQPRAAVASPLPSDVRRGWGRGKRSGEEQIFITLHPMSGSGNSPILPTNLITMARTHHYRTTTEWTGNLGSGTLDYRAYKRDHRISAAGKVAAIDGSSDPKFRGDPKRYNPEELFLSSLSACHMLWYLHLASANGITVLEYIDHAEATMEENPDGSGQFTGVLLQPTIHIAQADKVELAKSLHKEAGEKCFIANSVKVKLTYGGEILVG